MVVAEAWETRAAGPFQFYYHSGSYAGDNLDAIVTRYEKALADVCAFVSVDPASIGPIAVYLCQFLEERQNGARSSENTRLDLESRTIWTVVTSESAGAYPEFELTHLVLHTRFGPSGPEARFWEDGLAGYLAGKGGASYFAEAGDRAAKMREEGQLRPLVVVVRQYAERRSAATTTVAVAFVTYLIEWRGAERFRRFITTARTGMTETVPRVYGRPLAAIDQFWQRRMEATSQAGGGKALSAITGTIPFFRPYWVSMVGILIMILLGLAFDLFVPQAIRFLIDNILGGRPVPFALPFVDLDPQRRIPPTERMEALTNLMVVMVIMFLINAAARIRQATLTARVSQSVNYDLRLRLLEHIQRSPISFHSRTPATDIVQRFQTDIAYIAAVLGSGLVPMVSSGLAMIIFGVTLILLNPVLALVALAGLPIFAFSYRQGRAAIRANTRETVKRNQEIQQSVIENMNAQPLLKTWNLRPGVMTRFREKLDVNRELNVRNTLISQAFARASVLITNGAQVAVLAVGGIVIIWTEGRDLTAGGLMAFYVMLLRLYGPAGIFAGAFQTLAMSSDGLERVGNILKRPIEEDPPDTVDAQPLQRSLQFERATFAQVKGKPLLKELTLEIPAGSKVAFVGPTGAGKASLMQVLPRLYDYTDGTITWDGTDLKRLRRESIRDQIIVLSQDTFILNLTIYDNLTLGNPSASESEVTAAARLVGLHDFIMGLPGGYDTVVSDRDTKLGTPHRQRVAAVRALLRQNASVVLMDDALSAVDAADQRAIEEALRNGPNGPRTVIRIAQRLGGITDADQIYVMDGGEIVEHGTHDELLDKQGLYVQLIKDELGEAAVSGARQAVRRLSKLAPFSSLPPEVLEETARLLLYAERGPGETICRQGSIGDELYIIGRGDVEIVVTDDEGNERIVNVLGEGDYVGEISFLRRTPRTATVRAQGNVELHILRRLDFDALLERLGAGTLAHMEETAQARIEDTRQKLAALSATGVGE